MPRLPFDDVDLLIVDEMGKNLSGAGLDTNVIRRDADGSWIKPGAHAPRRIYVRSLHPHSYGNAVGVGLADFIHESLHRAMDPKATWINAITALMPANARIPIHLPNDREAIGTAMETLGVEPLRAKILWIKNTLSCQHIIASQQYVPELGTRNDLKQESDLYPLAFNLKGDLA